MDGLWHRRLRAESAFTFPQQATRFPPESYEPVQNLSRMKWTRLLAVGSDAVLESGTRKALRDGCLLMHSVGTEGPT